MRIEVDTTQVTAWRQIPRRVDAEVGRALSTQVGPYMVREARRIAASEGVGGGSYYNAFSHVAMSRGGGEVGRALVNREGHSVFVERGRRPGQFPNLTNLTAWVRRKGKPDSAIYPIGLVIQRRGTIKRAGYGGLRVFAQTAQTVEGPVMNMMTQAVQRGIKRA